MIKLVDMKAERDEALAKYERLDEIWRERYDNAKMQIRDLSARYDNLVKMVADGRAFMPSPPIYMTVAQDDASLSIALLREHGFGINSPDLNDALRQCLQAIICHRDNCTTLEGFLVSAKAERDALSAQVVSLRSALERIKESVCDVSRDSATNDEAVNDINNEIRMALAQPTIQREGWDQEKGYKNSLVVHRCKVNKDDYQFGNLLEPMP